MNTSPSLPLHYDLAHDLGIVTTTAEFEQLEQAAINTCTAATISLADASRSGAIAWFGDDDDVPRPGQITLRLHPSRTWRDWFGDHPTPKGTYNR